MGAVAVLPLEGASSGVEEISREMAEGRGRFWPAIDLRAADLEGGGMDFGGFLGRGSTGGHSTSWVRSSLEAVIHSWGEEIC